MSQRLKRYASTLKQLNKYSDKQKKCWLKNNLNKELVLCLCECAKNLLKGCVPLSSKQKKALSRRKLSLRNLAKKKVPLKKKRRIIQTGGFLGALLGPIISVLGSLFGSK